MLCPSESAFALPKTNEISDSAGKIYSKAAIMPTTDRERVKIMIGQASETALPFCTNNML